MKITPQDILDFWFAPPMNRHWFEPTAKLDKTIRARYLEVWRKAGDGALRDWQNTAEGAVALCIVLDQFPLNMFRGHADAYSTEQQAVQLSKAALSKAYQLQLSKEKSRFLFMPLMHSEHLADQDLSVIVFTELGIEDSIRFAVHHRNLIHRFGRFPHRNKTLGRTSTPEEEAYLASNEAFDP